MQRPPKVSFPIGETIPGTFLTPIRLFKKTAKLGSNYCYEYQCSCGEIGSTTISAILKKGKKRCNRCSVNQRTQNRRFTSQKFEESFFAKTLLSKTGCMNWVGCKNQDGYGQVAFRGKPMGAHRAIWILKNGPIPKGLQVLHSCDNPACVYLGHLFLGTQDDNMKDCARKGRIVPRAVKGEAHHMAKLGAGDVLAIRHLAESGMKHSKIANKFDISRQTVGDIVSKRRWKHI